MAGNRVNIDKMATEILRQMNAFEKVTIEDMKKTVDHVSKVTVRELRATSPRESGDYAKGWTYSKDPKMRGPYRTGKIVHVKKPDYRLTHLLEKPHNIVGPTGIQHGQSKAQPHIAAAEKHAEELLVNLLTKDLGGG